MPEGRGAWGIYFEGAAMSGVNQSAAVDVEALRKHSNYGLPSPYDVVLALLDRLAAAEEMIAHPDLIYAECAALEKAKEAAEAEVSELRKRNIANMLGLNEALAASEKRAGEYRNMILKFLAMEHEGYLMVDDATRAAWIEEAKALADPQHGGGT